MIIRLLRKIWINQVPAFSSKVQLFDRPQRRRRQDIVRLHAPRVLFCDTAFYYHVVGVVYVEIELKGVADKWWRCLIRSSFQLAISSLVWRRLKLGALVQTRYGMERDYPRPSLPSKQLHLHLTNYLLALLFETSYHSSPRVKSSQAGSHPSLSLTFAINLLY